MDAPVFSEEFELLVPAVPEFVGDKEQIDHKYLQQVIEAASELGEPGEELRWEEASIGRGADGYAILLLLSAISLFFQGKKIEENLDAWPRLGKRLRSAIAKLRSHTSTVFISEPVAAALALSHLFDSDPAPTRANLVRSDVFVVDPSGFFEEFRRRFRSVPERFYLFTFVVDRGDTVLSCVRSDGKIHFQHRLPTGAWYEFYPLLPANE